MLDTICTLHLPSDLFALALHPTEPILTVGLSSGHVYTYRLPSATDSSSPSISPPPTNFPPPASNGVSNGTSARRSSIISSFRRSSSASENGLGSISTLWSTRRHHGSCRTLTYSLDGESCFSAGTDNLVKHFDTLTGKVLAKYPISNDNDDGPTVLQVVGENNLLIATDSGNLELRDLRTNHTKSASNGDSSLSGTWRPHDREHINALLLLPASDTSTSGIPKSCVSVGGTTLAVTDFRKGVIAHSEDQDVELTSLTLVDGLKKGGTSVGQKILVGQGDGVVSLWERGVWGDLDERIVLDKYGAGVESLVEVPSALCKGKIKFNEKIVAAGLEDGRVRFLRVGRNGVLNEWDIKHDDIEGVVAMGFDVTGRLVSGGGQTVKVWTEAAGKPGGGRELGPVGGRELGHVSNGRPAKRALDGSDDDDDDDDDDEENVDQNDEHDDSDDASSDDEKPQSKRKKRKRNKGKDKSGGQVLTFSGMV